MEQEEASHLHINPQAMIDRLNRSLQRSIDLVAFGLGAAEEMKSSPLKLSDVIQFLPASGFALSLEDSKREFKLWMVTAKLRDCIEAFSTYLEEVRLVCRAYQLFASGNPAVTPAAWNSVVTAEAKQFHKLGLPKKIAAIRADFHLDVVPPEVDMVITVNEARNCLVHRAGVVTPQDVNSDDSLAVEWMAQGLAVERQDGSVESIESLPFTAGPNERLFMRNTPKKKSFGLGSFVEFTAAEFAEMCWSFFLMATAINASVEVFGRSCGINFVEAKTVDQVADPA
jgi:hypothetical protein